MAISPTQRTLAVLRKQGALSGVVEKWNSYVKIRQDLFGFVDLIAIRGRQIVAVQCCAGSGHAAHRTKILANEIAPYWLKAGDLIEIWSWSKTKVKLKAGGWGKAVRWTPRVEPITPEMFTCPTEPGPNA